MASACVNRPGSPPEPFIDLSPACPRVSFGPDDEPINPFDSDPKFLVDFEFRPDDPITMLPADELFAGGKLLPLLPAVEQPAAAAADICLKEGEEPIRRSDLSAPSPRAPRCSSRWRELLGLKKQNQQQLGQKQEGKKFVAAGAATAAAAAAHSKNRSLKKFLHRSVRSPTDPTLSLPLLRDSESEAVSRRSSSSSSSGPDHEDLPLNSLDSDKPVPAPVPVPAPPPISLTRNPKASRARAASRPRSAAQRTSRSPVRRQADATAPPIDSPRMNASGRVVFERSSSSPGSFTGGPRVRQGGMERSYSSGIRVAPVLNVPVFGLGQLFKKDQEGAAAGVAGSSVSNAGGGSNRIKTERP